MTIMIGIDPPKATHTAVAIDSNEQILWEITVRSSKSQTQKLRKWAAGVQGAGACSTARLHARWTCPADVESAITHDAVTWIPSRVRQSATDCGIGAAPCARETGPAFGDALGERQRVSNLSVPGMD